MNPIWKRPQTAAEVCAGVADAEAFGRNVRDWQHELRKVNSRPEFSRRIREAPVLLADRLQDHGQCDAYLAAYVEWLATRAGVSAPEWLHEERRVARKAWYDYPPLWIQSFVSAPAEFRRRGVFTNPENVLQIKPGRPLVSNAHRRKMNAARQKRYRERIRAKLKRLVD